jgi:hypothetical protein
MQFVVALVDMVDIVVVVELDIFGDVVENCLGCDFEY